MALKNILVNVDDMEPCAARLELAARLAADYDAHLTGIYVIPPVFLPAYIGAEIGAEVYEIQEKAAKEAAGIAESAFRRIIGSTGVPAEWRTGEGHAGEIVSLHARYADLTVVGQTNPESGAPPALRELPEHLVLDAGRPVLVVPYAGNFSKLGERILVAWNASREAARAVNDAMPLLERAKEVTVLAVNPHGGNDGHGDVPGMDISLHLARHNVTVEASNIVADDIDVGSMLLSRAADAGVDLIVMGAYGRSRLRELVMGGASREILRHMTVPVLMSH